MHGIWFSFIMFLLLILVRVTHTDKNTNSQPALPRTPCRPHCPVWPRRPDSDVQTFSCLVMLNRHIIKKYRRLLTLPITSWTSGWGETSFFKGKLSCCPAECSFCSSALAHSPRSIQLNVVYILPHTGFSGGGGCRGLAVTREEIMPFSVWNYNSRPAKHCQQRRESFDYAKWMDTSRLLLQ